MKTVSVCIGSACHLKGSYAVIKAFEEKIKENNLQDLVELKAAFCLGECTQAVSVKIDDEDVISVSPLNASEVFEEHILKKLQR